MAKGTWSLATDPNDPIFTGKWIFSSQNYRKNGSKAADPIKADHEKEDEKAVDSENTKQNDM